MTASRAKSAEVSVRSFRFESIFKNSTLSELFEYQTRNSFVRIKVHKNVQRFYELAKVVSIWCFILGSIIVFEINI